MSVHAHSYVPVFDKLQLMHGDVTGVCSCMHIVMNVLPIGSN